MKIKNKIKKSKFKNENSIKDKKLTGIFHPVNVQTAFQIRADGGLWSGSIFPSVPPLR